MSIYSVFTQILVISSVYVLGRLNCTFGWALPLLLSPIYDYSRRKRELEKATLQARSAMNERDWILPGLTQVDNLPPWIIFPDVERAEWINTVLKLLWPSINGIVAKRLNDLQPQINKISALEKFQFKTIDLGKTVS